MYNKQNGKYAKEMGYCYFVERIMYNQEVTYYIIL